MMRSKQKLTFTVLLMFVVCNQLNAQQDTTKYKPNHLYYEDKPFRTYSINGHKIHLTSYLKENPKAWREYEIQSKKEDQGFIFTFSGLCFAAAALGQIGQKESRLVPFAIASGVSMALAYPFRRAAAKHQELSIKNYNDGILSKYAKEDSAIYKPKLVLYDNVKKMYRLDGRGFCLSYYLNQYPLARKQYELSERKSNLSGIFGAIGFSCAAAALGQIGQQNNRGWLFVGGMLSSLTIGFLIDNKKSKKHLENAVNYYNARM